MSNVIKFLGRSDPAISEYNTAMAKLKDCEARLVGLRATLVEADIEVQDARKNEERIEKELEAVMELLAFRRKIMRELGIQEAMYSPSGCL